MPFCPLESCCSGPRRNRRSHRPVPTLIPGADPAETVPTSLACKRGHRKTDIELLLVELRVSRLIEVQSSPESARFLLVPD